LVERFQRIDGSIDAAMYGKGNESNDLQATRGMMLQFPNQRHDRGREEKTFHLKMVSFPLDLRGFCLCVSRYAVRFSEGNTKSVNHHVEQTLSFSARRLLHSEKKHWIGKH
jgi:hypothetical protein